MKETDITTKLEDTFKAADKVAVFIDGHHTNDSSKNINLKIDWDKVSTLFRSLCRVTCINFYLSTIESDKEEKVDWKPLSDWLTHNGYKVIVRTGQPLVEPSDSSFVRRVYKTGYDAQLIVDMLSIADKVDTIALFTSNSDLCPAIEYLQSRGVTVIIFSNSLGKVKQLKQEGTISTTGNIGVELIRMSNEFYELHDLRDEIGKKE